MSHHELLKGVEDEPLDEPQQRGHHRWIGALILTALMLTFLLPVNLLESLIVSDQAKSLPPDVAITLPNATVVIGARPYQALLERYQADQQAEFKACLLGSKIDPKTYVATDIIFPPMHKRAYEHVVSEPCPVETIIDLHTHPYLSCIFSDTDERALASMRPSHPDILMALMCAPDRFTFMGY